jgi:hypothetical protein
VTFFGQAGSIYLPPGLHNITLLPSYNDYSTYYPFQQNVSFKVGYYPVSLNVNYSSQNKLEYSNITGNMTGIMWIASSASNGKYVLFVGQGLELVDRENMSYLDLSFLNIPGFFRSVAPYRDGFIIGGSDDGNIALLFYINVSSMTESNYTNLLPRNIPSGGEITQISIDFNGSIVILGINSGGMFLGFIYNNKYFSLMNYLPQFMITNSPYDLSMTLIDKFNLVLFVNGDVMELNLSIDSITKIPANISSESGPVNFSPTSYNYISSENNTFLMVLNPSSGYQGVYEYANGSFTDISNLFPAGSIFFSSSWNGHDFLLSGKEGGTPLLSIYDPVSKDVNNLVIGSSNITLITATSNSPSTFFVSGFQGLFQPQFFIVKAVPTATVEIDSDSPGFSVAFNGISLYSPSKNITVPLFSGNTTLFVRKGNVVTNFSLHLSPFGSTIIYAKFLPSVRYYTVMINESGLPSGTSWSVTLNGTEESSTTNTITFQETNGTYSYAISSISGYRANTYSGKITITGNPVSIYINWTMTTYPITIVERGIPNGTSWSVTLTGTTFSGHNINITLSSTNNSIIFNEPNGSYAYTAHLPSGYSSNNKGGSFTVSGQSLTYTMNAKQSSQPATQHFYYLLIIIVVLAAGVAAVIIMRRKRK